MLDPLITAEIQTVRLKLMSLAARQSDQTVRSQCLAVDARLAEAFIEFWRIQFKRPYVGRRAGRSKRLLSIFSQGFAIVAVSRLKERCDPWRLKEESPTAKPPAT